MDDNISSEPTVTIPTRDMTDDRTSWRRHIKE